MNDKENITSIKTYKSSKNYSSDINTFTIYGGDIIGIKYLRDYGYGKIPPASVTLMKQWQYDSGINLELKIDLTFRDDMIVLNEWLIEIPNIQCSRCFLNIATYIFPKDDGYPELIGDSILIKIIDEQKPRVIAL